MRCSVKALKRRSALDSFTVYRRIREISNTYIALRYSPESDPIILGRFANEVRAFAVHSR